MADLAGLDGSLLVGIKDQEDLENEVFHEVSLARRSRKVRRIECGV